MAGGSKPIEVYLEVGKQRCFAGALDWPGWCRMGRDEGAALQALVDTGPRYARALQAAGLSFQAPDDTSAFAVVERLAGNSTTDFGAPDCAPSLDAEPLDDGELKRYQQILRACWQALDAAVERGAGHQLRKGPRGGGREIEAITRHVLGAQQSYLARLAWKGKPDKEASLAEQLEQSQAAVLAALAAAAPGDLPTRGPRGGAIWSPRYATRRLAWHVLDHAWEIEDRIIA